MKLLVFLVCKKIWPVALLLIVILPSQKCQFPIFFLHLLIKLFVYFLCDSQELVLTCVIFVSLNFLKRVRTQLLAILNFVGLQIFKDIWFLFNWKQVKIGKLIVLFSSYLCRINKPTSLFLKSLLWAIILSLNNLLEVIKLADMGFLPSDPSENDSSKGSLLSSVRVMRKKGISRKAESKELGDQQTRWSLWEMCQSLVLPDYYTMCLRLFSQMPPAALNLSLCSHYLYCSICGPFLCPSWTAWSVALQRLVFHTDSSPNIETSSGSILSWGRWTGISPEPPCVVGSHREAWNGLVLECDSIRFRSVQKCSLIETHLQRKICRPQNGRRV